ncbi:MAG: hypothetical protein ACREJD_00245 [Phycisphaerales bacterium]
MPPGKKPLPLFELVTASESSARREPVTIAVPPAPIPTRAPDFQPREPKPLPSETRAPRSAEGGPTRVLPGLGGKPVLLGTTALWLAAAAVLLIVFLVWVAGNAYGRRQAERQFELSFGQVGGQTDPQAGTQNPVPQNEIRAVSDAANTRPSGASTSPAASIGKPPTEAPGASIESGQVLTAKGVGADPRQSGWNYLLLGMLSREEATGAIQFFAKNGVETVGVPVDPVDRKSPRGNTSPRFQLFAAKGIPSTDFATKQLDRDKLKLEIVRLGAIWKKDHKGSMSFSDAFWLKND